MHRARPESSASTRWALELVVAVQLLGLILNRTPAFPFHHIPSLAPVADAAGAVALGPFLPELTFSTLVTLSFLAIGFVLLSVVGSALYWLTTEQRRENRSALRIVGGTLRFGSSIGLIPLLSLLLSPCQGQRLGYTPFSALHIVLLAAGSLCAVALVTLACVTHLMYFNMDSTSSDVFSRPHGRVEAVTTLAAALLVLVLSVQQQLGEWVVVGACCLFAALYTGLHLQLLPHYRIEANAFRVATGASLAWAAVALVVGQMRNAEVTGDGGAAAVFWLGLPFVAYSAAASVQMRARSVQAGPLVSSSPYLVEIKLRMALYELMRWRWLGNAPALDAERGEDPEEAARTETIRRVESLYRQALQESPHCSLLHRFFAHFLDGYKMSRSLELTHLGRSNKKAPALDTQFVVYLRKQQMEDAEAAASEGGMSVGARIRAEKHHASAQHHGFKCRTLQVQFWEELLEHVPDLNRLSTLAKLIEAEEKDATQSYEALLQLNPNGVAVLRGYAQFLIEVANRPARAQSLLEEADAIEDEQSRWQEKRARDIVLLGNAALDTSSDQTGVCTIGSEGETQGIVKSVNAHWHHLFGYTRREMVGQNINSIMPEPIASVHNALLRHSIDNGGDRFMNRSRMVLAKHADGFLFPAVLMVRLLEDAFGGLLQRIETTMRFILFVERGLRVTGMCEHTATQLGVSPQLCLTEAVSVDRFVPHIQDALDAGLSTLPGGGLSSPHRLVLRAPEQLPGGGLGAIREVTVVAKFQRLALKVGQETLYIMQWYLSPESEEHPCSVAPGAESGAEATGAGKIYLPPLMPAGGDNPHASHSGGGSAGGHTPDEAATASSGVRAAIMTPSGSGDSTPSASGTMARTGGPPMTSLPRAARGKVLAAAHHDSSVIARRRSGPPAYAGRQSGEAGEHTAATAVTADGSGRESKVEGSEESAGEGDEGEASPMVPRLKVQMGQHRVIADPRPAVVTGKKSVGDDRGEGDGTGGGTPIDMTRSQAGSSQGSSTSSAAVLPMLQRIVDVHSRTPEPALRALRSIFLWALVVAASAAVVTLVVNGFMVTTVEMGLEVLEHNGRRQMLATRMTGDALSLSLASQGLLPNTTADIAALRASLRSASDEFFHIHQDMYDHALQVGRADVLALYTEPTLTFVEKEGGTEYERRITLLEAGLEFVKRARLVAEASEPTTRSDPDVAFLLANGVTRLQQACNFSSLHSVSEATAAKTAVVDLYLWQFVAALLLVEASLVWFVQPAVREIQHTKEAVFQMFLDVPRDALTDLRNRAQRLLSAVVDGEVAAEAEHPSEEEEGPEAQDTTPAHSSPAPATAEGQVVAGRARRRKRSQPRTMSRSHTEQFASTVRFGGGMFFVLFYFAAAFLVVDNDNVAAMQVPHNVYYSTQRYAAAHDLYLRAVLYVAPADDGPGRQAMLNSSLHTVDKVLHFSHILLFGDVVAETTSELSFSDDIKRKQLDNGCVGDPEPVDCASFQQGLFRSGLAAATRNYLRTVRVVLRERAHLDNSNAASNDRLRGMLTDRMADVREMDRKYLSRGLRQLTTEFVAAASESLQSTQDTVILVTVLFMFGFVLFNAFIYPGIIARYDHDIKQTRAMLLMFPEESITSTPYIRQLMKRMVKELK